MADTERTLGALGTVEEAYRAKGAKRYSHATKPSARIGTTTIHGSIPSAETKAKKLEIERATSKRSPKPKRYGGNARWVEYKGYSHTNDTYGVCVKVTGVRAETYWLSWTQASNLWYEITGESFTDVAAM